jgi:signal transduction histidine kinase
VASIRLGDAAALVGLYVGFAFLYATTLYFNRAGQQDPAQSLFSWDAIMNNGGLQYAIQLPLTVLVWAIIFRVLQHRSLALRLSVHLVALPAWVLLAQFLYYQSTEALGMFHLVGAGSVWDLYIPALFYILQFGIIHAYAYYLDARQKERQQNELRLAALRSELSAIKAQLNPHFLYNVFNTINASIPPELESTREMIAELSDMFRYQLRASREDLVPLRDELAFVQAYLALEKKRFEYRLTVQVDVPEDLLDEPVPPMLLQPLVENAVKHGLASLIEGGHVIVLVRRKNGRLHFSISDTGIGVKNKEAVLEQGVGLRNTQLRLQKMYGSRLILRDNEPRGLTVEFDV